MGNIVRERRTNERTCLCLLLALTWREFESVYTSGENWCGSRPWRTDPAHRKGLCRGDSSDKDRKRRWVSLRFVSLVEMSACLLRAYVCVRTVGIYFAEPGRTESGSRHHLLQRQRSLHWEECRMRRLPVWVRRMCVWCVCVVASPPQG